MRRNASIGFFALLAIALAAPCRPQGARRPVEQPQVTAFNAEAIGSGARAMGMGGAFIAVADDASAALWNPAGIAQLEKREISASLQAWNDYESDQPALVFVQPFDSAQSMFSAFTLSQKGAAIDFFSFLWPFKFGSWHLVPEVSYRRAINEGLDMEATTNRTWSSDIGVYQADRSVESEGGYDVLALTVGVGRRRFSGGTSVNIWRNGFHGTKTIESQLHTFTSASAWVDRLDYSADVSGVNATVGFLARPVDTLSLGMVFRTPFTLKSKAKEKFTSQGQGVDSGEPFVIEDSGEDQFTAKVDWPWSLGFGVAVRPANRFKVAFDYTLTDWSDAESHQPIQRWDEFGLDQPYPMRLPPGERRKDADQFRSGFEYLFISHGLVLPLRAGAFLERQFFVDAFENRSIYKGFSLGGGVGYKKFMFDVAGVYEVGSGIVDYNAVAKERVSAFRLFVTGVFRM
jgi:hypothetical protein